MQKNRKQRVFGFYSLEVKQQCMQKLVHYMNYHIKGQICEGVTQIRQSDTTDFTVCHSALFIRWAQLVAELISLCNTVLPQVFPFHLNGTYSNLYYSYGRVYGSQ